MCLADAGFAVREACTGGDALPLLDNEPPDAVVLDLGLPDHLGGAVLERLREDPRQRAPAWVVISALRREDATRQYGPVSHFLAKPFDPWTLVDMLERLMEKNQTASVQAGSPADQGFRIR